MAGVCGSDYGQEFAPRTFRTIFDDAAAAEGIAQLMPMVVCPGHTWPVGIKDLRLSQTNLCESRIEPGLFWQRVRPLYICPDGSVTTAVMWVEYVLAPQAASTSCSASVSMVPLAGSIVASVAPAPALAELGADASITPAPVNSHGSLAPAPVNSHGSLAPAPSMYIQ